MLTRTTGRSARLSRARAFALGAALTLQACEVSNAVVPFDTTTQPHSAPEPRAGTLAVGPANGGSTPVVPVAPPAALGGRPASAGTEVSAAGTGAFTTTAGTGAFTTTGGEMANDAGQAAAIGGEPNLPPPADCGATPRTFASLITLNVSWDESLGIIGASAPIHIWSQIRIEGTNALLRPCGGQLPIMMTTPVAGSKQVLAEVPFEAFDAPTIPHSTGSASRQDGMFVLDTGTLLLGLNLVDPDGPWPGSAQATQITGVDSEGDGKPGVTAFPREGGNFTLSPTSVLQLAYADGLYGAQRFRFQVALMAGECPDALEGPAQIVYYDTRVIGCHVRNGRECSPEETRFINDAKPVMNVASATWSARLVPSDATCSAVRAALPVPAR